MTARNADRLIAAGWIKGRRGRPSLVGGAVASRRPIALLAATRPGAEAGATLAALERLFIDTDGFAIHELEPLGEQESVDLVRAAAPEVAPAEAAVLWRRVGGSPYWLLALARAHGTEPTHVLGDRLRRLSADGVTLIALLAVAGRPTAGANAANLLGWPAERLAAAIQELVRSGLALEAVDGLRPAHDLVREAVVRQLPDEVRRDHHVRLARGYEAAAEGDLQQLVAALRHRTAAGLPTLELALRVAESERRQWLDREALEELARIADRVDPADPRARTLAVAVASLASDVGESAVAFDRWRELIGTGSAEARAEARLAAAREAFRLRRPIDLEELLAGAEAPAWADVDAIEVGALRASSRLWLEARFPEGHELATEVAERARRLDPEPHDVARLEAIGRARWAALKVAFDATLQAGDWGILRPMALEMLEVAAGLDDRRRSAP